MQSPPPVQINDADAGAKDRKRYRTDSHLKVE
jgi:hypothetical protein